MAIIYCILNTINNKRYVGQSISTPNRRWQNHRWKLRKGDHYNTNLQAAWNKYGEEAFSFRVLLCGNFIVSELNTLEQSYIKLYDCLVNGYNQNEGGYNRRHTSHTKEKLSVIKKELYKNSNHHWLGQKHSKESREKMSAHQKLRYENGRSPLLNCKGEKHSKYNNTVYSWIHKDGTVEKLTAYELSIKYNLNRSHVGKLYRGERKTHKGWRCNAKIS
jgi:group I intron endonuclease